MKKFTITLLLLSLITSCSSNTGELSFMVNFPKSSKILSEKEKIELKRKIEENEKKLKISSSENDSSQNDSGVLLIEIK